MTPLSKARRPAIGARRLTRQRCGHHACEPLLRGFPCGQINRLPPSDRGPREKARSMIAALRGLSKITAEVSCRFVHHHQLLTETLHRVPSIYSPGRLTPLAGGIRDGAHPRGAPPPHCPGWAAAHSVAQVRPWPTISGSGSDCSSPRTSTGSPADAV